MSSGCCCWWWLQLFRRRRCVMARYTRRKRTPALCGAGRLQRRKVCWLRPKSNKSMTFLGSFSFFFLEGAELKTMATLLLLMAMWSSMVTASFLAPSEVNTCDISEFRCPSKDGQGTLCLPMDRWCNGKDDCDNRVDEPRSCTSEYIYIYPHRFPSCCLFSLRTVANMWPVRVYKHRLLSKLKPFVTGAKREENAAAGTSSLDVNLSPARGWLSPLIIYNSGEKKRNIYIYIRTPIAPSKLFSTA